MEEHCLHWNKAPGFHVRESAVVALGTSVHVGDVGQENSPSKHGGSDPREVRGKRGLAQAGSAPTPVQFVWCFVICWMFKGYGELRKETPAGSSSLSLHSSVPCRRQKFSTCRRTKGLHWFQRLQLVWSHWHGSDAGRRTGSWWWPSWEETGPSAGDRGGEWSGIGMKSWEGEMLRLPFLTQRSNTCREPIGMGRKNMRKQETNT